MGHLLVEKEHKERLGEELSKFICQLRQGGEVHKTISFNCMHMLDTANLGFLGLSVAGPVYWPSMSS